VTRQDFDKPCLHRTWFSTFSGWEVFRLHCPVFPYLSIFCLSGRNETASAVGFEVPESACFFRSIILALDTLVLSTAKIRQSMSISKNARGLRRLLRDFWHGSEPY